MLAIDAVSAYIRVYHRQRTLWLQASVAESPSCSRLLQREDNGCQVTPIGFLASLESNDFDLLLPQLKPFELVHEDLLFAAGETRQLGLLPAQRRDLAGRRSGGRTIDRGRDGRPRQPGRRFGRPGRQVALNRGIVQVGGVASILDVEALRTVADQSVAFRTTLIRHEQAQFAQAQQSAACNVSHSVEARLSRWLLRTRDAGRQRHVGTDPGIPGADAGRAADQRLAGRQHAAKAGLIRYRRGHIEIPNLEGLRETACECYETVKAHNNRLIGNGTAQAKPTS